MNHRALLITVLISTMGFVGYASGVGPFSSDAECRKIKACTLHGECSSRDGFCIATSEADCRASYFCGEKGRCTLKKK